MQTCPYCNTTLSERNTFCEVCGYSFVLPLPPPFFPRKKFYYTLSLSSILLGILSCIFTYFPALYMSSIPLIIGTIALGGVTLERAQGKSDALLIKILAIVGLVFGVLGYIFFMFIHSNVPGIGYSM